MLCMFHIIALCHVRVGCAMSEYFGEMEEGGQCVDVGSAVDASEQQRSGSPPLLPQSCEGEAVSNGPENHTGAGQLSNERENGHLKADGRPLQQVSDENSHGGEEGDEGREDTSISSDGEEEKNQNVASSAKPTRLVQLPLARVKK